MPRTKSNKRKASSQNASRNRRQHKHEHSDNADNSRTAVDDVPLSNATMLNIAVDIGTTTSSVSYQVCAEGDTESPPIWLARLCEDELDSPMIVMYDADGTLHEGPELVKRLNDGTLSEDDILRFAKLALQPSAPTMDIYNKVAAHLTHCGKTTEEMIADYLQRLLDRAKASIKQTMYGDVSKVPTHVFLSVPQIWSPESNLALVAAAKKAGAVKCSIVPEPLAAAACVLHDELNADQGRTVTSRLRESDLVLVADLGGGTADLILFRLCSSPANGPAFSLEVVRPATGNLAGATQINRNFLAWLQRAYYHNDQHKLERAAADLGCNTSEFLARCSTAFESAKLSFPRDSVYNVIVNGKVGASTPAWLCTLSKSVMQSLFDPVIDDIVDLIYQTTVGIDDLDDPQHLGAIILCGGLGSSSYVRSTLKQMFNRVTILHPRDEYKAPVSKGSLLRYSTPIQRPLGYGWSLCCIRNEDWSPKLHPDATIMRKRKRCPRRGTGKADPHDQKTWVVEDRCVYILDGTTNQIKPKWSTYHPPVTATSEPITIAAEVFWTIKPDPTDHEPLYVSGSRELRPCFERFCVVKKTINPAAYNFKQVRQADGELDWEIHACVTIRRTTDSIELGILIRETEVMYDDNKMLNENYLPPEEEWTGHMQEIWDPDFSHLSQEVSCLNNGRQASTSGAVTPAPGALMRDTSIVDAISAQVSPLRAVKQEADENVALVEVESSDDDVPLSRRGSRV